METGNLVAVESVAGRIDLDLDLRTLRRAQLAGVLERRDRIALAEMHQHRAARLLGDVRVDLRGVVADRRRDTVELGRRRATTPCRPSNIQASRPCRCRSTCCLRRSDIGEHLIPGNPAAQVAAGDRILLRVAELDAGTDAVEQRRRHDMIALRRIAVADAPDVRGDAEDLLQQNEAAARRLVRPRLVGRQHVPVLRAQ